MKSLLQLNKNQYGRKEINYSDPVYKSMKIVDIDGLPASSFRSDGQLEGGNTREEIRIQ